MATGKVILVRGIPGSGKSHHVEVLRKKYERQTRNPGEKPDFVVCSADHFFMVGGQYLFDPTKLPQAHNACLANFLDAIHAGTKVVVVDNTFIRKWEMKNYVKMANFMDYEVDFHEVRVTKLAELMACISRNVHRVPAEVVAKMALEFEPMDDGVTGVEVIPFFKGDRK